MQAFCSTLAYRSETILTGAFELKEIILASLSCTMLMNSSHRCKEIMKANRRDFSKIHIQDLTVLNEKGCAILRFSNYKRFE